MEMSEESGATSKYNDDGQIDDSLQSIQKIRDEILRKESILQERSAQCDMDIQTLLSCILPMSHFKHGYIYNHAVELLQFCGQHYRQVFLGAICFQKFCTKLWCITLFIVDKSSTALCDVQIVHRNCGQFWQDVFLDFLMFWQEVASILVPHFLYSSCFKTYAEGKMTPKVVSIIRKYKETSSDMTEVTNSSCSRDFGQSITKRKKLKEALLRQCKELDEICRGAHWILPRYTVLPLVSDGMYHASVRLRCPDFEMSLTGGLHPTPHVAKCSATANMILELHKKAEEQEQ